METTNIIHLGWSFVGLGGAIVLMILLFATNFLRNDLSKSRWRDPVWLAWLAVPIYLLHQFEEYALHFDFATGIYKAIEIGEAAQGHTIPLVHFPVVNIALVWFAVPLAAWLCKRNPVVGLSYYGFILVNGLGHVGIAIGTGLIESPGGVTSALFFVPISVWVIYVCLKSTFITKKGLIISLLCGIIGHIALFGAYAFHKIGGTAGLLIADVIVSFIPLLLALWLSKILKLNKVINAST
jgi:hypothetical protein